MHYNAAIVRDDRWLVVAGRWWSRGKEVVEEVTVMAIQKGLCEATIRTGKNATFRPFWEAALVEYVRLVDKSPDQRMRIRRDRSRREWEQRRDKET
jgi:hypothetical protein